MTAQYHSSNGTLHGEFAMKFRVTTLNVFFLAAGLACSVARSAHAQSEIEDAQKRILKDVLELADKLSTETAREEVLRNRSLTKPDEYTSKGGKLQIDLTMGIPDFEDIVAGR